MPRILLVDDQKSIREQLKLLLATKNNFELIGTAENGSMAIEQIEILKPDIILLDLQMLGIDGIEVTKIINNRFPESIVIILTSIDNEYYLEKIKEIKIAAILPKSSSDKQIIQAIEDATRSKKRLFLNLFKSRKNTRFILLFVLLLVTSMFLANLIRQLKTENNQDDTSPNIVSRTNTVVALGTLIPKGETIKLSVANAEDSRVNQILVEEGDLVQKNQVIAILQGIDRRERDLEEAQKTVELAQAQLEKTLAGETKQAELAAQRANISRLESQLRNEIAERQAVILSAKAQLKQASLTYDRNKSLQKDGAVSQQAFDSAQESLDIAKASLNERKAQLSNIEQTLNAEIIQERENLAQLQEIRPVDVKVTEIELERAIIAVEQRKVDLEDTKVKVPISGQILRINTRVGEQVNTQQGIVELGRTNEMYAVAEVYETDIGKVKIGQPAIISSEYGGFSGNLKGKVEHLGLQVGGKQLSESSQDPTQDENTRIVEVKIRINPADSKKIAGLTNMKVRVEINNY